VVLTIDDEDVIVFIQTNSELCRMHIGGHQEEQTAIAAIRSVAGKDARITSEASDDYPIIVTIKAGDGTVLWRQSQKKLYRKYAVDRENSIQEIQNAVKHYLMEFKSSQ